MPGSVFISYRRTGGAKDARAIFERLRRELAGHEVFIDLEGIEPGEDFVESLERQLDGCEALVVLIGPDWSDVTNEHGQRRLDDENDFVRIEIAAALRRGVKVFPVLIDGARPPRASELPEALQPLVRRQAVVLDYAKFDADILRLARAIAKALAPRPAAAPATPSVPETLETPDTSTLPGPVHAPEAHVARPGQVFDAVDDVVDAAETPQPPAAATPDPAAAPPPAGPDGLPAQRQATPRKSLRWKQLLLLLVAAVGLGWGVITLSARQDLSKAIAAGAAIYKSAACIACHGENGAKSIDPSYPQLSTSKLVSGPRAELVRYFANVGTEKAQPIMRAQVQALSDEAVAQVATYLRNVRQPPTGDMVTAEEVHAARKLRPPDYVPPERPDSLAALSKEALMAEGGKIYAANCAVCHRPDGRGAGPIKPLDRSALVTGAADRLVGIILHGANNGAMPSWVNTLNKADIASVATFIRNQWHNATGDLVQPRDVAAVAQLLPQR